MEVFEKSPNPSPSESIPFSEKKEIEIKTALAGYIRTRCHLEGRPEEVEMLVRDMSVELFELICYLTKGLIHRK